MKSQEPMWSFNEQDKHYWEQACELCVVLWLLILHGGLFLSGVELRVDLRTDTKKTVVCFDRDWSTCLEIGNFF